MCKDKSLKILSLYSLEAKISSTQNNVTVFKGLPFKLGCTSLCRPEFYHVMWMTEGKFISNDEQHEISSSRPFQDSQNHELIVHSSHKSATYQCLLITTTGRIVDSVEQHVLVEGECTTVPFCVLINYSYTENNQDASSIIEYLMPYLRWAN